MIQGLLGSIGQALAGQGAANLGFGGGKSIFDLWRRGFEGRQRGQGGVFDPSATQQIGQTARDVGITGDEQAAAPGPSLQDRVLSLLDNPTIGQLLAGQGQPQLQGGGVHQYVPPSGLLYQLPSVSPFMGLLGRMG